MWQAVARAETLHHHQGRVLPPVGIEFPPWHVPLPSRSAVPCASSANVTDLPRRVQSSNLAPNSNGPLRRAFELNEAVAVPPSTKARNGKEATQLHLRDTCIPVEP